MDYENIVLVAATIRSLYGTRLELRKTIGPTPGECKSYDNAAHFNFVCEQVENLRDVLRVVEKGTRSPHACLLRCVPIDPKKTKHVRRIIKMDSKYPATLVEQRQHWYAIDVDGYGVATGDVLADARTVLLGLPEMFHAVECIALASGNYMVKPGIRMRMFFWNREQITGYDLKRYFAGYGKIVDLSLFNLNQPIYVATANYVGMPDPIDERLVWIDGLGVSTDIPHVEDDYSYGNTGEERPISKVEATRRLQWITKDLIELSLSKGRNEELFYQSRRAGKLVAQEHYDRADMHSRLLMACDFWEQQRDRDISKDNDTIGRGLDQGIMDMGGKF